VGWKADLEGTGADGGPGAGEGSGHRAVDSASFQSLTEGEA
jgi:hypothetical protein